MMGRFFGSGLRATLATLLVASFAARYYSYEADTRHPRGDFRSAVLDVLRFHQATVNETPWGFLVKLPQCERWMQVAPLSLNLQEVPELTRISPYGYVRHYFYIEVSSGALDRYPMYLEWFKQSALGLIGQSRYFPIKTAIMVAQPPECDARESIDWRLIWKRTPLVQLNTVGAPRHNSES